MADDRKNLYFGWLISSALITVLLFFLLPQLSSGPDLGYTLIIACVMYIIVLFLWVLPFIFLRALFSEIVGRRKKKSSEH